MITYLFVLMLYNALISRPHDFIMPDEARVPFSTELEKDFFSLSSDERYEKFHSYSLEDQFTLMLTGNLRVHPPLLHFTIEFAKNGSVIVPMLKEKLKEDVRGETVRDITRVIKHLKRLDLYDVHDDKELMQLLTDKVNSMDGWKDFTLEILDEL